MDENTMYTKDSVLIVELNRAVGSYSGSLLQISGEINQHLVQINQQLVQQKNTLHRRLIEAQQALQSAEAARSACYAMQAAAASTGGYVSCSLEESNVAAAEARVAECQAKYSAACNIVATAEAETAKYHAAPEQRLKNLAGEHTSATAQKLNKISADLEDYLSDGVDSMCPVMPDTVVTDLLLGSVVGGIATRAANSPLAQPALTNTDSNSFNQNEALKHLQNNASVNPTKGYCAKAIREALNVGGINIPASGSAKNYVDVLPKYGFESVPLEYQNGELEPTNDFQQGDIMVCKEYNNHKDGHIQMYDGENWFSDYKQKSFYPWSDVYNSNEKPDCELFRYKS